METTKLNGMFDNQASAESFLETLKQLYPDANDAYAEAILNDNSPESQGIAIGDRQNLVCLVLRQNLVESVTSLIEELGGKPDDHTVF